MYSLMYPQVIVTIILLAQGIFGAHLPPEIPRCSKTDVECMIKSTSAALHLFKDGSKEFGLPKLEPFFIKQLQIEADPAKSVKLNQDYENVYLHGIIDSQLKEFKIIDDGNTCTWEMTIGSPVTWMEADYKMTGQVLVFPINGYGRCNVTLQNVLNKHTANCEHYMKKGKSHLRLKNYKMDMSVEKCHFDFPNIMPGNEQISRELGKTVNENSLEIFQDVKGGFEEVLSRLHENGANSVFAKVPEDELFLP